MVYDFPVSGKFLASAMDFTLVRGFKCFGTHELFFNGLIAVLYGAMGLTYNKVAFQANLFWEYRFPFLPQPDCDNRDAELKLHLQPDFTEECTFVSFLSNTGVPKLPSRLNDMALAGELGTTTSPSKRNSLAASNTTQAKKKRSKSAASSPLNAFD